MLDGLLQTLFFQPFSFILLFYSLSFSAGFRDELFFALAFAYYWVGFLYGLPHVQLALLIVALAGKALLVCSDLA